MKIHRPHTGGFSLLELAVVLGLVTIAMVGVVFAVRGNNQRELQQASLTLQADLRYTQRRAMLEGVRAGIVFEPAANRYHLMVGHTHLRTVYLQGGVTLMGTIGGTELMFLPRGTASSGFRIVLGSGGYSQHLTATVSGGRIQIWEITRL